MSGRILPLSNTQAKTLAGCEWRVQGRTYIFKPRNPNEPGTTPWKSGAEGKAYPLLNGSGVPEAYIKFFSNDSVKRFDRAQWLIAQRLPTWLPHLAAAPSLWLDSRVVGRPDGIDFDITGCVAEAAPGDTWLELKFRLTQNPKLLPAKLRWRMAEELILALAVLEKAGLVHGDLSPNNLLVHVGAPDHQPAVRVIDFDAFAAPAEAGSLALTVAEGGTYGTEGYCPPDLVKKAEAGELAIMPYSDRRARDMLLLEFLFAGAGHEDRPPAEWDAKKLGIHFAALHSRCPTWHGAVIKYLDPAWVFNMTEQQRPSSKDLANALNLSIPDVTLKSTKPVKKPTANKLGLKTRKTPRPPPQDFPGIIHIVSSNSTTANSPQTQTNPGVIHVKMPSGYSQSGSSQTQGHGASPPQSPQAPQPPPIQPVISRPPQLPKQPHRPPTQPVISPPPPPPPPPPPGPPPIQSGQGGLQVIPSGPYRTRQPVSDPPNKHWWRTRRVPWALVLGTLNASLFFYLALFLCLDWYSTKPPSISVATSPASTLVTPVPSPTQALVTPVPEQVPLPTFTNSLGMVFGPVAGTEVLFSVWDTRVRDYAAFVQAGVEPVRTPEFTQEDMHPVVNVSWDEAKAFCQWLTEKEWKEGKLTRAQDYRLPMDWEWSMAVGLQEPRAGTPKDKDGKIRNVYPWGSERPPTPGAGNYHSSLNVDSYANTSPVGSFAANRFGLYDMGGNVWQWCEDWYDKSQTVRVLRGGSWSDGNVDYLLSSARFTRPPERRVSVIGFRVVLVGGANP